MITIQEVHIYPVKSCRGFTVSSWPYTDRGFKYDREWMIISERRSCQVTQREQPKMSLLECSFSKELDNLLIKVPDQTSTVITIPTTLPDYPKMSTAKLFDDEIDVVDMGDEPANILSTYLNYKVRLVRMPSHLVRVPSQELCDETMNNVITRTVYGNDVTLPRPVLNCSLADCFPFLLASKISIAEVDKRSQDDIQMMRFRPNIVVSGTNTPFEEDTWQMIELNGDKNKSVFYCAACCDRCTIPNVNPEKGVKDVDVRIVLSSFRKNKAQKLLFGVYLVCTSDNGVLTVGDSLNVLLTKNGPDLIQ